MLHATENLEAAFARWSRSSKLERDWLPAAGVIGTGFGRGSLLLALNVLDARGREVLLPNFICRQVVEAVERAGAQPVFYPIGRDLSPQLPELSARLSGREAAVILPHLYGCALSKTKEIMRLARARQVPVIEDCAQAWGARLDGQPVGTLGDLAAFSLTKSDWNFGGGLLAIADAQQVHRARELALALCDDPRGAARYGILRLADYVANRPRWCRLSALAGSRLERMMRWASARGRDVQAHTQNFYDLGRFDSKMSAMASRRGLKLLKRLERDLCRRREKASQIVAQLASCPGRPRLVRPETFEESNWAYLLFDISETGKGLEDWIRAAERRGITLRPTWPFFQEPLEPQKSEDLDWLAENLLVLEIHPRLTRGEVRRITDFLDEGL